MGNYFTALGTSAAIPTKNRSCSAYYLQIDGDRVLIDCGEGTQRQLVKYVQNGFRLTKIFISHAHADHILGLPGLLFSMNLNGRNKQLGIFAPAKVIDWVKAQINFFDIELNFDIEFTELDTYNHKTLWRGINYDFVSFPLDHTAPCAGLLAVKRGVNYKIRKSIVQSYKLSVDQIKALKLGQDLVLESGDVLLNSEATFSKPSVKLFAYVSDTRPIKHQEDLLSGVHHVIHESTFCEDLADRADLTGHSTANQAAQFAKFHSTKHLYLGHFSSRYLNAISFLNEASSIFQPVSLLSDGMKVKLEF
jgi:ribonuclease Z